MEPREAIGRPSGTMRRILVCTGVLGGGTALVFALATLAAIAFPQGSTVPGSWGGWARPMLMGAEPVPAFVERAVVVDDAGADGWLVPGPAVVPVPERDGGSAGF